MKRTNRFIRILGVCSYIFCVSQTFAYDEPIVNLGFTSFLDGTTPSGPGFYFQDYLQYYTSNRLNGNNGDKLPLPHTSLDVTANLFQLIYLSKQKIWQANWGIDFIAPWLMQANINDGLGRTVLDAQTGAGDIVIGPMFQFDPIMGANGPRFVQRFEFDFIVPTGKYNPKYAVNPGSNFWSFNPYWSATLWFTKQWSSSIRLYYLWNAKNNNPNLAFGSGVNSTQAGRAVFANITTEYGLTEKFYLGLNGYIFDQVTDTKVNGSSVPGRREYVWAIGPGLLYSFTKNDFLFFNSYFEQDAKNRPQGSNFVARYVHHFS